MMGTQARHSAAAERPTKRVIVYTSKLLPWSHTFIREQVLALRDWHPVLVADRRATDSLPLADIDDCLICPPEHGRLRRGAYLLCRLRRRPHAASVRQLRALDASLVHAHFGTLAVDVWPLVRALGLPMLVTLHGYDINIDRTWWESGKRGWRRRRYPCQLLTMAQEPNVGFIAVSNAIRKRAIAFGIPADKIVVRHIGIDTAKFAPGGVPVGQRAKRVLFVGRLVEKKGLEYLIRAFAGIQANAADAELVIIGDGPLRKPMQALARNLGVRADFRGILPCTEIAMALHQARVLCAPSITATCGDAEGLPTVVVEALACGVPVVTSANGADAAVINAETGYIVAHKACQALADGLTTILCNDTLAQRFAENARRHATANFSIDSCTARLEEDYANAACPHGHAARRSSMVVPACRFNQTSA